MEQIKSHELISIAWVGVLSNSETQYLPGQGLGDFYGSS